MTPLRRVKLAVAFAALLASTLAVMVACDAPPARAAQAPAQAPTARADQAAPGSTTWRTLGQWTGTGSRQTESFDVTTGALRLRWETRSMAAGASAGSFRIWLHSAISGRPLQLIVEQAGPGAGTSHVTDDPRVSYLVVESDGVAWSATLDEATGSSPER